MKNFYSKSILAMAVAAIMAVPANATFKRVSNTASQPAPRAIVTDTKTADMHWLKGGQVQARKKMKEIVAPNGHTYTITANNLQKPATRNSRADEELDITVNLTMPEVEEGFILDGNMAIMVEIDGYNSAFLLPEDDETPDVLQSLMGIPAGTYAIVANTFKISETEFIGIFYQAVVEVTAETTTLEIDFNECDKSLTYEMVGPKGEEFAWGTEEAPFVSLDFMSHGIDMGIWGDSLCPVFANVGDESCSYSAVATTVDRENMVAIMASGEIAGPFEEDKHYSVTQDQYSYIDNTFNLTPQDKATGIKGLSFMAWTEQPDGNSSGQGGGTRAEGEAVETVGMYGTMGESEIGGTCYLASLGTVTNYDEESWSMETKMGGRKVKLGETWYVVPQSSYFDVETFSSSIFCPIDLFNINCDEQDVQNFRFTPMAQGGMSFWVYDLEDFVVADIGVGMNVFGMFNEYMDELNPMPYLTEITLDGEAIDPTDLLEQPMPDANMTITYNYDNVYVNDQYPAYVKATNGFYTYSELPTPAITAYQSRCNDKITNVMAPESDAIMYLFAAGYDAEYNMDLTFDWTCSVAEEGSDEWIPVTLDPKDSGTDYGAECAIDLGALGLKLDTWYKLKTRVAIDDANFNEYELGHCFFMASSSGIADAVVGQDVVSSKYYDLNGRQIQNPAQGVYLRQSVLSDGSVINEKVIK